MPKEREFELFKKYFLEYYESFGLYDWRILNFIEDKPAKDKPYSTISYIIEQHECWVIFYGGLEPYSNKEVKEKALHEVLHLLLAPYRASAEKDHRVINRLLKVILGHL